MVNRLHVGRSRNHESTSGRTKRFSCCITRLDRVWVPPNLSFNGKWRRGSPRTSKTAGERCRPLPSSCVESRNFWSCTYIRPYAFVVCTWSLRLPFTPPPLDVAGDSTKSEETSVNDSTPSNSYSCCINLQVPSQLLIEGH
jgi:hypothetical protein